MQGNKEEKGRVEKYFTHIVGWPLQSSNFYKDFTPSRGFAFNNPIFLQRFHPFLGFSV